MYMGILSKSTRFYWLDKRYITELLPSIIETREEKKINYNATNSIESKTVLV